MQYTQRKLQRSVTEMRRSCIERPSVSRSVPPAKAGAGVRPELIGMTFITMVLLLKNHSRQGYSRGMESMKKRVAVIMQRRPMDNRWQSEVWEALGVLADYDAPGEARAIVEEAGLSPALVEVEARVGCAKASCPARASSAPAARQPHVRIRFQGVHALEGRGRREARGAEEAVFRSALQRHGRPRHLHRRLHEGGAGYRGAACAAGARPADAVGASAGAEGGDGAEGKAARRCR